MWFVLLALGLVSLVFSFGAVACCMLSARISAAEEVPPCVVEQPVPEEQPATLAVPSAGRLMRV